MRRSSPSSTAAFPGQGTASGTQRPGPAGSERSGSEGAPAPMVRGGGAIGAEAGEATGEACAKVSGAPEEHNVGGGLQLVSAHSFS